MRSIYRKYFNSIMLICVVLLLSFCFSFTINEESETQYMSVLLNEGDTLWQVANQYKSNEWTNEEFIKWVEAKNDIRADRIQPGQTIVIPVKLKIDTNVVASR